MKPIISVVIPCKNEEKYIEKCIRSVYTNKVEGFDIEVIVCDGVSEDQTPNIVESLRNEYPLLQFQINHKQYTPFALNLGIENARGDYICILGAHATMKPDFLSSCYKIFSNDSAIGCVGGILNNTYENDISEAIGLAMNSSFGVGNAHFRTGNYEGYVDTVAFGLYKKEVFEKVGLFDPYLIRNQDDDFNFRLTKNGYKLYLINKVVSDYAVRGSFKKLYKQYYQYGYWKVYVNKKHQNITTFRQLVPFFFCLYIFSFGITSIIFPSLFIVFSIPFIIYLFTALLLPFKMTNDFKKRLRVSYSFFILHISYGFGYCIGVLDFLLLGKKAHDKNISSSR